MAEPEKKDRDKAAEAPSGKKGPPIKVIAVVAALMVLEGVAVFLLIGMSRPSPQAASAEVHGAEQAKQDEAVEIALVDEKFQNMQTGKVWIWDVELVLKVKGKNAEFVNAELAKRASEVTEGVGQIIRRAEHRHLKEPDLTTISRQLTAYINKVFGNDAEGQARVERLIVPKFKGLQID